MFKVLKINNFTNMHSHLIIELSHSLVSFYKLFIVKDYVLTNGKNGY